MSVFLAAAVGSMVGQFFALWVIGFLAHRQELKKAHAIQNAFEEAMKEVEEKERKMREYARLES